MYTCCTECKQTLNIESFEFIYGKVARAALVMSGSYMDVDVDMCGNYTTHVLHNFYITGNLIEIISFSLATREKVYINLNVCRIFRGRL